MATHLSLWVRVSAVNAQYQSAVLIPDLIIFAAYAMTELQHQVVYNVFSFVNYKRMAANLALWMRVSAVNAQYQIAVFISDSVIFISISTDTWIDS